MQSGSTLGGFGSPSFNLSQAQFQQRTATAYLQCKKCKKGTGSTRYCKALIDAKFHRCPDEGRCGEFRESSCAIAAQAQLEGCPTKSCTTSNTCGKCPCKECKSHSHSKSHCCSSSSSTSVVA